MKKVGNRAPEEATLLEVQENGLLLTLLDGRRLRLANVGDITMTLLWLPTTELELSEGQHGVTVRNLDDNEAVIATWA